MWKRIKAPISRGYLITLRPRDRSPPFLVNSSSKICNSVQFFISRFGFELPKQSPRPSVIAGRVNVFWHVPIGVRMDGCVSPATFDAKAFIIVHAVSPSCAVCRTFWNKHPRPPNARSSHPQSAFHIRSRVRTLVSPPLPFWVEEFFLLDRTLLYSFLKWRRGNVSLWPLALLRFTHLLSRHTLIIFLSKING